MKKLVKKLFYSLAIILLLGTFVSNAIAPSPVVLATNSDDCDKEFTHHTDDDDFHNHRVNIDVQSYSGDDDRRVVVSPKPGYKLTFIGVDYTGNDNYDATPSVEDGHSSITYTAPNNQSIDNVTVKIVKVCAPWSVSINEQVSCGAGQKTFTGTASYGGDTGTTLLVKINGSTVINSQSETTSWSFNRTITTGTEYIITAAVYDSSDPDTQGSHQDTPKATDSWTFTVGACTPSCENHQYLDNNVCVNKTPVCTNALANNYDDNVSSTEISNDSVCTYSEVTYCVNGQDVTIPVNQPAPDNSTNGACPQEPQDACPDKDGIQTSTDECEEEEEEIVCGENQVNQNGVCINCDGGGTCELSTGGQDGAPTPTPTDEATPTPTQSTNVGGPGDGLSDGRSDGLGGQSPTAGEVLGANTMAQTGGFGSFTSKTLFALGLTFTTLASAGHAKKKK